MLALLLPSSARAFRTEMLTGIGTLGRGKPIEVVSEEAMVQFASGTASSAHDAVLARVGASVAREFPDINWAWVRLSSGMPVAMGLRQLRALPEIVHAEPNHFYRPNVVPNDALISAQGNLSQIDAFAAWEFETGFTNAVTIAVIDTGIDATHTDLAGKILSAGGTAQSQDCNTGACVANDPPTASCNHATRVAGIAAATANNGAGIAGISWGAKLLSLKVFPATCSPDCSGTCGATDNVIIAALTYVRNMPVGLSGRKVVNMSLGSSNTPCTATDGSVAVGAVQAEMALDTTAGIVLVVAAGNDGSPINQPANCAGTAGVVAIPVGSVDSNNNPSWFTSRGPELAGSGVVAPGEFIETTDLGNSYTGSATGTSFSSPHVAGLAALVLSAKPAFTPAQVQNVIRGGADSIGQPSYLMGAGRINAFRAIRLAVRGTLADFAGDQRATAFPNPFRISQNGAVSITIPVALQGPNAKIVVYTPDGQLVRTIKGLTWDGRNDSGNLVASGTYVFNVTTDNGHTTGRVAVIR